ncbi:hypothetical protein ACJRO7_033433 [Eucalyptus globulus]|uniref:Uncharacterized protein n=1 Tax=Eucalyptus globulus TaxID=34317 RepID=A0ABD3JWX6_EUCGL
MGMVSLLRQSHKISKIKTKTIMNNVQLQFFPPDLVETRKKSFGTSKVIVEETAKSAAEVLGKVVHKMAAKVKERMSNENEGEKLKTHNLANPKLSQKMHRLSMMLGCATILSTKTQSKRCYDQNENLSKRYKAHTLPDPKSG